MASEEDSFSAEPNQEEGEGEVMSPVEDVPWERYDMRKRKVFKCPLCFFVVASKHKLFEHISTHDGHDQTDVECTFCQKSFPTHRFRQHVSTEHPDESVDVDGILASQVVWHTNLSSVYVRSMSETAPKNWSHEKISEVLSDSVFEVVFSPQDHDRFSLKICESFKETGNILQLFRMQARDKRNKVKCSWTCAECGESENGWLDVFSARLFVLRHLSSHVDQHPELDHIIQTEYSLLEGGSLDLSPFKHFSRRLRRANRCVLNYCLVGADEVIAQMESPEMRLCETKKEQKKKKKKRKKPMAVCLLCCQAIPLSVNDTTPLPHFSTHHPDLNVKGVTEFELVADEAGPSDFQSPLSMLQYMKTFYIEDEENGVDVLEWRCSLCVDVFGGFPNDLSLRLFALRHIDQTHPDIFDHSLLNYEWSLLDCKLRYSLRGYKHRAYVDIIDPSDFVHPLQGRMFRRSGFFVCAFCFFVARTEIFLAHIASHSYVPCGKTIQKMIDDPSDIPLASVKIRDLIPPKRLLLKKKKQDDEERTIQEETEKRIEQTMEEHNDVIGEDEHDQAKKDMEERNRKAEEEKERKRESEEEKERERKAEEEKKRQKDAEEEMERQKEAEEEKERNRKAEEDKERERKAKEEKERQGEGEKHMKEQEELENNTLTEKMNSGGQEPSTVAERELSLCPTTTSSTAPSDANSMNPQVRLFHALKSRYVFTGPEPPKMNDSQNSILRTFNSRLQCELCRRRNLTATVRRVSGACDETLLLSHLLLRHADNEDAKAIVERKRFLVHQMIENDQMPKLMYFMLDCWNFLKCCYCEKKANSLSKFVSHLLACLEKFLRPQDHTNRAVETVSCSICRNAWRRSEHYSEQFSIAAHLLLSHTTNKIAYQTVMDMNLSPDEFPFVDFVQSFAARATDPSSAFMCSKCNLPLPNTKHLIRHASSLHLTKEERRQVLYVTECTLCKKNLRIKTAKYIGRISVDAVRVLHVLCDHSRSRSAFKFLSRLSTEQRLSLETEIRLNVLRSKRRWMQKRKRRLVCSLCKGVFRSRTQHLSHKCSDPPAQSDSDDESSTDSSSPLRDAPHKAGLGNALAELMKTPAEQARTPAERKKTPAERMKTPTEPTKTPRNTPRTPTGRYKCAHCDKSVPLSSLYTREVATFLHNALHHKEFISEEDKLRYSSSFPFIGVSSGKFFECSLCPSTSSYGYKHVNHLIYRHEKEAIAQFGEEYVRRQKEGSRQRVIDSRKRIREEDEASQDGGTTPKRPRVLDQKWRKTFDSYAKVQKELSSKHEQEKPATPTSTRSMKITNFLESRYTPTGSHTLSARLSSAVQQSIPSSTGLASATGTDSLFAELPETLFTPKCGEDEDISHIAGADGIGCSVCSFRGRNFVSLRLHFNAKHTEGMENLTYVTCRLCDEHFSHIKKLILHYELDHKQEEKPFGCVKCSMFFATKARLQQHNKQHEETLMVHPSDRMCKMCQLVCDSRQALKNHQKTHADG